MTVQADFTVEVKHYDPSDPRLGRHVKHDSRSLLFQVAAAPLGSLVSKDWPVHIPVLDQGQLGSCTGNAGTANLASGELWDYHGKTAQLDEAYAVQLYSDATKADPYQGDYPPTDTGSDGLSIAKVLTARGLVDVYQHATSLEATLTALQTQAVITGTEWRGDMFSPDGDGRLHITGSVEGGHEYLLNRIDVENKRVWMRNSWGTSWGIDGEAWFTWDDFGELLAADGDVTVMHAATATTPTPSPADPAVELRAALSRFLTTKSVPSYVRGPATRWLG